MENNRIAKKVYAGEWGNIHSGSSSRKRGIDTVKDCLKKRGLNVRQEREMVYDRVYGECL